MKKFFILFVLISVLLIISSCTSENDKECFEIKFSEYYQNAEDYQEISILINNYFECIQNAYEKSDKRNLSSFSLSDDYKNISNKLSEINNNSSISINEKYLIRLQILEPYLQMEVYLAERDMLLKCGDNNGQEWYINVKEFLENTYYEYRNREDG